MIDQGAETAETKLWAEAGADGNVVAGLPALPAGEAQEGADGLPSDAQVQQHHGQRWQQQVTGGGAPFLSVSGSNNVIIITGLAAQHLVSHQPVHLQTGSGDEVATLLRQAQQQQKEGAATDAGAGAGQAQQAQQAAHWIAYRAAAQAAGKRKSPEPGLAQGEEAAAPSAKATRTGRAGRGKPAAA